MLGPKCNNGFITFRTNGLLHLGPTVYYILDQQFITFRTNGLLHFGPTVYYI